MRNDDYDYDAYEDLMDAYDNAAHEHQRDHQSVEGDKVHWTEAHPNNVYTVTEVYDSGRVQLKSGDGIYREAAQGELY